MQHLDYLGKRLVHPGERIRDRRRQLAQLAARLRFAAGRALESAAWRTADLLGRVRGGRPDFDAIATSHQSLALRLKLGHARQLEVHAHRLAQLGANLDHLNPRAVLERGYSIVAAVDGRIVRTAAEIAVGDRLRLTFAHGSAGARVEDLDEAEK